jgi:hypothetical protein
MSSKTDIGIRHILAVYPLISVGAACSFTRWIRQSRTGQQRRPGWLVAALPASALAVVLLAYPQFLSYMNPLAGGTENGYRHLLDSNYDWGQDVIRLKKFLKERGIDRIYLQYFGTQAAIDYYKIPYDFVDSDAAKQIQTGCLVVSAQALMRPEWKWLRDSRKPVARVGYSLFVYEITPPPHPTLPTAPQS